MSRLIGSDIAESLIQQGWKAADLHVHTTCSCDVLPNRSVHPEVMYQRALDRNMSFVTFTDHDTMDAYDEVGWNREHIVTGVEIKVRDYERVGHTIHLNIFELNRRQFSEVVQVASKTRNIEQVIDYLTAEKLPYSYNHPFWFEPGDTPNFEIIPSLFDLFPVVEYNMQRIRRKNLLTLKLAEKHGCGVLSTTDSHTGEIAKAFTLAQGESFGEFFANICQGNFFLVAHDLTVSVMTGQMVSWLDSLFHPEDALDGKVFKTGYRQLDRLLDSVLAGALDEKPISYRFARILAWAISRTRIPAFLYLLSQDRLARDFVQRMENNRPLFGIDHP